MPTCPAKTIFADVVTKPLPIQTHHKLITPWLFRQAKVIDDAANPDCRKINMVRIPTDEAQDRNEQQERVCQYMHLFKEDMVTIKSQGRKKEYIKKAFQDIRKANQIVDKRGEDGFPRRYNFQFIMTNGREVIMTPEQAIATHRSAVALLSNLNGWPKLQDEWAWTADQNECKMPLDTFDEE